MTEAASRQIDESGLQGLDRSLGRLTGGFSIRLLLLSAVGFLSILLLTALGLQAATAWATYRTAAQFAVLNEATDNYIAGLQELIKELESKAIKTDGMRMHGQGPGYSVYVIDPGGNRIELSKD
jgi:hypothetical protein